MTLWGQKLTPCGTETDPLILHVPEQERMLNILLKKRNSPVSKIVKNFSAGQGSKIEPRHCKITGLYWTGEELLGACRVLIFKKAALKLEAAVLGT